MDRPLVLLVVAAALLAISPTAADSSFHVLQPPGTASIMPSEAREALGPGTPPAAVWPTYLFDPERTGANLAERTLAPSNVSQLAALWTLPANGSDFSAPIVVNNTLYYGSWNGDEYAVNVSTGSVEWSIYLGTDPGCGGYQPMGISSTAAYQAGTLYLGGGNGTWYALDAATGHVEWSYFLGTLPAVNNYDWASALVYGHSLYIGVSSCFDNPLIRGALIQVNLTGIHTANHTFYTVPSNETGDSIWTTPALDPGNNTIWVSTGNENTGYPPYANAIIGLNATTLAVLGSWQVQNVTGLDSDFGSTPTLFHTSSGVPMVVATNKNGVAYAFDRANVTSPTWGPVWTLNTGGGFSSGAFYGNTLFLAGNGLYAVDPSNGSVLWENTDLSGIDSALTWANGIIYVGSGGTVEAIDAQNGTTLWTATVPGGGSIVAESVVADGQLYVPSGNYGTEGNLTVYGIPFHANATAHPTSGTADLNVNFQANATGGLTPYTFQWAFGDGGRGTGPDPVHSYTLGGNYTARVWVNDSASGSVLRTMAVHVLPGFNVSVLLSYYNLTGPVCPGVSPPAEGPLQFQLTATASGGVAPYTYQWSFSTGGTASGATIRGDFTGPFTANLEVIDSAGHGQNTSRYVGYPIVAGPACLYAYPWVEWLILVGIAAAVFAAVLAGLVLTRRRRRASPPPPPVDRS